jgi:ABC-type multidrug transport system ATPase subunit
MLRSAALLSGDTRMPIPSGGLTLGSDASAVIQVPALSVSGIQAEVVPTETGHAIVERARLSETFVNGERLIVGERRPLHRGDSIAVAGRLLHYLPSGAETPRLARVSPVDAGRFRTSRHEFTVGRDPDCDLVLDHPTVSRRHALIRIDGGAPTIEDQGSAVGIRVNGVAVQRTPLQVGDQIAVGPYRIVFDGEDLFERAASSGLAVAAVQVRVDVEGGTILHPTDLNLRAGELVAIIGESGAGKSTLLRTLAGVSLPTSGRVLIGGESVQARVCELGYVPQFDIVHDQLTITEALDFAARLRLPPDTAMHERTERVGEVIAQLGLTDRADIRLVRLSGGQRKRVAVGVELLHRPGALFLDEPTTGLDPGLERHMSRLFRELADTGQTVALVTHATGSMALFDRVVVMGRGGYLRFDGRPDELLETFGVEQFDDVYTALSEAGEGLRPHAGSRSEQMLPPLVGGVPHEERLARPVQQSFGYQTRVLAHRYATLLSRDRRHLRSALIQVPVLGLLTALLFVPGVFAHTPLPHFAAKSSQLIFLMVTIAVWLGSINAAREIVKERNVLNREHAVGVQIPAYLASKLIVLLSLAAVQTVLFSLIVLTLRPLHERSSVALALVCVLVVSSWIAVLLGLLVSAYASSEDQATAVIPMLLIPQLLFSGAIVQIADMTTPVRLLAGLIPARWSFAAAGHVIHLQQRINEDPVFSRFSHYGQSFFSVSPLGFTVISAMFASALFAAIIYLLRRP